MKKEIRPKIVTLFGVLEIIFSVLGLIFSVIGVLAIFLFTGMSNTMYADINVPTGYFILSFFIVLPLLIVRLISAINLLKLKDWARRTLIVVAIINIAYGIIDFNIQKYLFFVQVQITPFYVLLAVLRYVYIGLLIYFLTSHEVKKAFISHPPQ